MPDDILRYLEKTRELYTKYAHHKEAMAWAGVVVYAAVVGETLSRFSSLASSPTRPSWLLYAMLAAFWLVAFLYVRGQFAAKKRATNWEGACMALIAERISRSTGNANYAHRTDSVTERQGVQRRSRVRAGLLACPILRSLKPLRLCLHRFRGRRESAEPRNIAPYVLADAVLQKAKWVAAHGQRERWSIQTLAYLIMLAVLAMAGLPTRISNTGAQGIPQPSVVTGSEIRLVDAQGKTRALLAMEDGNPVLCFLNRQGKGRAIVSLQEYGPSLVFTRENGSPGASIGLSALGLAMAFGDSSGSIRVLLTVDQTGAPQLVLKDSTGHVVWSALQGNDQ